MMPPKLKHSMRTFSRQKSTAKFDENWKKFVEHKISQHFQNLNLLHVQQQGENK